MHLTNLSLAEFSALLGAAVAVVTLLYLLDRRRKRQVVSTLRFWKQVQQSTELKSRAHVQQPWSLLLQLLALALLMLAIGGLDWNTNRRPRSHVLIFDASSASLQTLAEEKRLATEYLTRVSPADPVMLMEASGLVVPRTAFTTRREETRNEINAIQSSETALALNRALNAARQALALAPGRPGEIVYVGPGRVAEPSGITVPSLRLLHIQSNSEPSHIVGMVARPGTEPVNWTASVQVRNDSPGPANIRLRVRFGASEFATRSFTLLAGQTSRADYDFHVTAAGTFSAAVDPGGSTAKIDLPRHGPVQVIAYTRRPDELRALLASDPRLSVRFETVAAYHPDANADILILDGFAPGTPPRAPSLWIDVPDNGSPFPVLKHIEDLAVASWTQDPQLGIGLSSHDLRLAQARVLRTDADDIAIASTKLGPVAVARPADRVVALGFDPLAGTSRLAVTSPLLIANALRWLTPDAFSEAEMSCREVGTAVVELPREARGEKVSVTEDSRGPIAFVERGGHIEFFVDRASDVEVRAGAWRRRISLQLPQTAANMWTPAGNFATGLPARSARLTARTEIWRGLALAAGLLLVIDWLMFGRPSMRSTTALRWATAAVLMLALFASTMHVAGLHTATIALVDQSEGIAPGDLARAKRMLKDLARKRGRNVLAVVPFMTVSAAAPVRLERVSEPPSQTVDLEAALGASMAAAPEGYSPRVLLLTNGDENRGVAARAIAQLGRAHIPIDTLPLASRPTERLQIASLVVPRAGYAGELLPVNVIVEAPQPTRARLRIEADGKLLGEQTIDLESGRNTIPSEARVNGTGAIGLSANVITAGGATARLDEVVQLSRAQLLYYSQDLPGTEANLLAAMKTAGFDVNLNSHALDGDLSGTQVVVLNNVDLNALSQPQKQKISDFVERGGGLLIIGGEHQVYKDSKQMDVLDHVLPAKLTPPRNPEGICVALIIDKSSSMEGRKIDLARISAVGVVDHLTPKDTIGVLIFDNSYEWAVPMRKAADKQSIKSLISGITPDGGTQIAPALAEAFRRVLRTDSAYKHIVLLTDGISEEGDSLELSGEALAHHVTISTVGLGMDVNRSYLERIASLSGGKSYFLNTPQGLEQLMLKDVQDYTGATTVEKPLTAIVKKKAEVLDGVDMEHAPPLKGYARYEAQPGAETLLSIDQEKHDPLFVRWQFGLGRAAVFASDAKSRWADAWMSWPGYDKFWGNVLRDLATRNNQTEARAEFDPVQDELRVQYQLPTGVKPTHVPDVFVLGPDGSGRSMKLIETSPGVFEGHQHAGNEGGVFRVRPLITSALFPEIGLSRTQPRKDGRGVDEDFLRAVATQTGGRYNPPAERLFDAGGAAASAAVPTWPALLVGVVLLDLCELTVRKHRGLRNLRLWRHSPRRDE